MTNYRLVIKIFRASEFHLQFFKTNSGVKFVTI